MTVDQAVRTDRGAASDRGMGVDDGARPDVNAIGDGDECTDRGRRIDGRSRVDVGEPVDAGRRLPRIGKERDRIRERQIGVGGSQDRAGCAVHLVGDDHRRCGSPLEMRRVLRVRVEAEIARAGLFDAGDPHDVDVAIALELTIKAFGDVPQLQGLQYTTAPLELKLARAIIQKALRMTERGSGIADISMVHATVRTCAALLLAVVALLVIDPAARAATRPTPLDYTMTTLPNGMKVVFLEDHSTPIVHTEVWYHVGSKNEKPGRTGFAHLFEHMMFKGSKNVEPEGHPSWISSIGGQSNAYTTEDATVFWQTTPAQYLPLVLWLEADRLASLRISEDVFKAEREVVKEERRMRIDNQPYGRLNELIYDQAFTVHPYKHPTIGSMHDLEAASVEDVRDFFHTYYVPSNATVVIVGDFETREAQELVTRYLGRVPKSDRPVPRDIPKEPPQTRERRITLEENWPLPAVVVAHHITYDGDPDSYPLHIASKVLSDGQSSRIYRKLVYEKQLALAAFGGGNIIEDPNLFYAVAIVQPGHTPEEPSTR